MDHENGDGKMTDPLTGSMAFAKGVNAIVPAKLRDNLFGPLSKAYGDHWGEEAKERLATRRAEKRSKNMQRHLNALSPVSIKRSNDDILTDIQFEEWAAGAAEIDQDIDPELANFWRAALVAIAQGNPARARLLRIVRALGPDDAVYLAAGRVSGDRFRPSPELGRSNIKSLEQAGVLEGFWPSLQRRPFDLITVVIVPVTIYVTFSIFPQLMISKLPNIDLIEKGAIPFAVCLALCGAVPFITRFCGRDRWLSYDGEKLFELLNIVRQQPNNRDEDVAADQLREITPEPTN